ncbi:hypothetical protein LB467_10700 [Salegentibacter sp. JZCK2]|uniref:hypothetical protein n=1 Tax=Salegentibacter tibetensis TaxID=2873600 RepID=UPI001CCE19F1|nr:hypothetical protein [Salegentibacter tibetensis]MBZ9730156.1 hypothetical protein [Salegentibacter tibetensis]
MAKGSKFQRSDRSRPYLNVLDFMVQEKTFLSLIIVGIIVAGISTGYGRAAMWVGFFFAAYAAVANDSIQSLGTFIESNKNKKWWVLWLFTGGIFLATVTFSWIYYDGDVTYQRLLNPDGTSNYPHPEQFSFFQVIAPLVLLILTRLKMPVSTTFLLLSVFSADTSGITSVVWKSWTGYIMAFILSFLVWYLSYNFIKKYFKSRKTHVGWTIVQWVVSGTLWAVWVMQDGANIAVFLPREQTLTQFIIFALSIFAGLGFLYYLRGDKIQEVVSEKVRISDIRAATLVDLTYVILLIYKLFISTVPMSTTWVFLGIIGGREIAISLARNKKGKKHRMKAGRMIFKDFSYAMIGLFVSVALAAAANQSIRDQIIDAIF